MKKSNKIMVGVLAFILTCFIGYALFSENVVVDGTLNASGDFKFKASCMSGLNNTNLQYVKNNLDGVPTIENGYENEYCNVSGDNVSFGANFKYPTAIKYFSITLENTGTIDAVYDLEAMDTTIKNCWDLNGDGKAEEGCDTSLNLTIVYPLSIIHNGNECILWDDSCQEYEIKNEVWKIPSGAKLNVLTAVTWPSALSTEDYSGVLMKMESSVKFNFEQVKN